TWSGATRPRLGHPEQRQAPGIPLRWAGAIIGNVAYRVDYSPVTERHMRYLTRTQQVMVLNRVGESLAFTPTEPTRHRKRLRPNSLALAQGPANRRRGHRAMKSVELGNATGPLADYAAAIEEGPVVVT